MVCQSGYWNKAKGVSNLKLVVLISGKIGRKGGELSKVSLWTLQTPCIILGPVPTG